MTLVVGDCRNTLARWAAEGVRVQTVVTSPPYWGLRDYGVAGQLGLEATPEAYVARMVDVFRLVRDVLADDGTCWLNLGDSYNGYMANQRATSISANNQHARPVFESGRGRRTADLKAKDLVGIPWRVAFALQGDGWVLRQEIIWAKKNCMPESVEDRCTKSHEQLFMLSKGRWRGPERGRFSHISREDARWLALLIDAEGSIVIKRNQHEGRADTFAPQVSIGSTSHRLLEAVASIVGHGNILERKGKNAAMFYWQVANGLARDLLYECHPHFIVKQRQSAIAIHVDSLTYYRGGQRPERKERTVDEGRVLASLWQRCKACNHFAEPDLSDVPDPRYGQWDSQRYYYDAAAIRETSIDAVGVSRGGSLSRFGRAEKLVAANVHRGSAEYASNGARNRRSVWTIATQPYPEAHFATMPEDLVKPCILAGSRPGDTVLDPFMGSGTVAKVAQDLGRAWLGCELNPQYADLCRARTRQGGMVL